MARRNYKYFFWFICSVTLYIISVLLVCLLEMINSIRLLEDENTRATLQDNILLGLAGDIPLVIVSAASFLTVWPLISLCWCVALLSPQTNRQKKYPTTHPCTPYTPLLTATTSTSCGSASRPMKTFAPCGTL